jgi:hypothetical protein
MGFMNFFHKHRLGPMTEDGRYQYCEKCGKAVPVDCAHIFELTTKVDVYAYEGATHPTFHKYEKTCKHCGRMVFYDNKEETPEYPYGPYQNGLSIPYYIPK